MLPEHPSRGRVLIVDDTPANIAILAKALESEGYEILVAQDGETGLNVARRKRPDLVLLDLVLPDVMGIEVLEALRREEADANIVLTTAYGSEETAIRAMRLGVNDYIINKRPFDADEVREVVRRALTDLHLRRENRRLASEPQQANTTLRENATRLEHALQELQAAYGRLQELEKAKSAFLSLVSHELRSPITVVRGYVDLIDTDPGLHLRPETRAYFSIIHDNLEHLGRMIDDLIDLSRVDAGRLQVESESLRPSSCVRTVVDGMAARAAARNLHLSIHLPDHTPLVRADPRRVVQVLTNLLDNACKFTPDGGQIELSARVTEGYVEFCVRDSGVGILPEDLARVFDRFYQVEGVNFENRRGVGLGLAVARELVQLQGGTLWAESDPGKGSRFYFTLPLAPVDDSP